MEMEPGKLFIGGISWDTNEDRLREYFETFGDVVEAVIMKDRNTGRARGFGFVVYADPNVAERVVREKHIIDGRTVEAKKAVPRDDQNVLTRNSGSLTGSPGPIRTKKIFVGGLASTVTETDFRTYFDQFGTITDVVVMYDHNTQRPRGFGFITYDSEEAVEKVLLKTFHELNGKMVEVKRAVPKEQSPGPNRNQVGPGGYKMGLSRVSSLLNAYTQGYNIPSSVGGYGLRMEDRFGRSGYSPFGPSSYGMGLNFEQGLSPSYAGNGNFSPNIGSGRGLDPFHTGSSSPSRYNNPMEYAGYGGGGIGSFSSSTGHSLWGGGLSNNSSNSNDFIGSRSGIGGLIGGSKIWGSSKISGEDGVIDPGFGRGNISYDNIDNAFGFGRNSGNNTALTSPHAASSNALDGLLGNLYGGGSFYGDSTWRSSSPELDTSGPFDYGPGGVPSDVTVKNSSRYVGGYSVNNGADRGIVT